MFGVRPTFPPEAVDAVLSSAMSSRVVCLEEAYSERVGVEERERERGGREGEKEKGERGTERGGGEREREREIN